MSKMTKSKIIAGQIISGALHMGYLAGTTGFNKSVITAITRAMDSDDRAEFGLKIDDDARTFVHAAIMAAPKINPDARVIDTDKKIVCAYEVEDTHLLTTDKMVKYHDLAGIIEEMGWNFVMMPVTRFGRSAGVYDIDQLECFMLQNISDRLNAGARR